MVFFVLAGAISFCVFIAMYLQSVVMVAYKKGIWLLIGVTGIFGIIARSLPQLNSFIAVGSVGIVAAIFFIVVYKNMIRGGLSAVFLMALLFGIEGLTVFSSRLVGAEGNTPVLFSLNIGVVTIVFLLAFLLQQFLSKQIWANILHHRVIRFLLVCAGAALVLILKNFVIDGASVTLGQWTMDFGDIALLLFLASGAAMIVIIVRFVSMESAHRAEMMLAQAFMKYVHDLEESYTALRTIKHDYVNILTSFKLYIDSEDIKGLGKYYYEELSEINKDLLRQDQRMGSLQNIKPREIKSILAYKCAMAEQHEINTDIEVSEPINTFAVSTAVVCQILGILLDNAIDAAAETANKKLHIAVINNPSAAVFIVKNTWVRQAIPINKMFELGFSTKSQGSGMGLYTVRKYTEKIKGLHLETEVTDTEFIQTLTIKAG
ncbi:MAG: GHKL domain-containing protein [Defluviitaleaceae bacterium]|nr:GHKL domain-containing protein [Defluviitaleaceae bacterium]MCL2274166.1 GHKL domain-containing protein [Defluviitaleaceae bacterium]